jgi:hypothetical protein
VGLGLGLRTGFRVLGGWMQGSVRWNVATLSSTASELECDSYSRLRISFLCFVFFFFIVHYGSFSLFPFLLYCVLRIAILYGIDSM